MDIKSQREREWLENLGDIVISRDFDGVYEAKIELLYHGVVSLPEDPHELAMLNWEIRLLGERATRLHNLPVRISQPVGSARTRDESISKLFDAVMTGMDKGQFYRYRPKSGQSIDAVLTSHAYKSVQNDDPMHDHQSTKLIDFLMLEISDTGNISTVDFEENHVHLIDIGLP